MHKSHPKVVNSRDQAGNAEVEVEAELSLIYISMLLGRQASNQQILIKQATVSVFHCSLLSY